MVGPRIWLTVKGGLRLALEVGIDLAFGIHLGIEL